MFKLKRLIPHRVKYGPTVTYYCWWRFQVSVRPHYRDATDHMESVWGVSFSRGKKRGHGVRGRQP